MDTHIVIVPQLLGKGSTTYSTFTQSVWVYVCQNVLTLGSPNSRAPGDIHPCLSVSLVFKSQWDIQKLSTIKPSVCRWHVGFTAQHIMRMGLSEWSHQRTFIFCTCWSWMWQLPLFSDTSHFCVLMPLPVQTDFGHCISIATLNPSFPPAEWAFLSLHVA